MQDVDAIAEGLRRWGCRAKQLPRGAWEAEAQIHPLVDQRGARLGRLVPGHGVVIDTDLKAVGITKPIPGVIERSRFMRHVESLLDDRAAITSLATLQTAYQNTKQTLYGSALIGGAAGGSVQVFGSGNFTASPGSNPTRTNAGALNGTMLDPPAGSTKYIAGLCVTMTGASGSPFGFGQLVLVDVLAEMGALNARVNTVTTVTTPALTRYTTGVGVYASWWVLDIVTLAASTTITVKYTNQAGTSGQTATFSADGNVTPNALDDLGVDDGGRQQMPLASGDYGVRAIDSIQFTTASTAAAPSTVGVHLFKPLIFVQSMQEPSTVVEYESRADPAFLVALATTVGGTLGCLSFYYYSIGMGVNPAVGLTLDTLYG